MIKGKYVAQLENEFSKDIINDIYQGPEGDGIAACLEEVREAPTIDTESLLFTVGKRADYLEELYMKMQAVTGLTPERLLELFVEGYTLQAPDYRKNFEEMQRMAHMDWEQDGSIKR